MLGKVAEIDENGDAWIAFEGLDEEQGVLRENFGNISVLSQEEAGKLEMVTMFIDAEMVTMFIDVGSDVSAKDKKGKGAFDHTKEIKDEEKRAAVLALMAEYSVLCAVATGKADLVAAAVAKGWRKLWRLRVGGCAGSHCFLGRRRCGGTSSPPAYECACV